MRYFEIWSNFREHSEDVSQSGVNLECRDNVLEF